MKAHEFEFPEDRRYLKNHVWIKSVSGNRSKIGITELGQSLAKEIVHIDLPDEGEEIKCDDVIIAFETIKAVSQITLPFDVKVVKVNDALWKKPSMINRDPYNVWLVEIEGDFSDDKVLNVEEAVKYYDELINKERERFSGYD